MKKEINNHKSKEFNEWVKSYFSDDELNDKNLIESHFHAWCGARNRASEILDQYHNVEATKYIQEKVNAL